MAGCATRHAVRAGVPASRGRSSKFLSSDKYHASRAAQKGSVVRGISDTCISDTCLAVISEDFDDAALAYSAMSAARHHSLKMRATWSGQAANVSLARLRRRAFGRRVGLPSLPLPSLTGLRSGASGRG